MTINLNVTRIKKKNEIWEIFSIYPNISYAFDPQRQLYFELWKLRCKISLHGKFKLLDIKYLPQKIIHIYEFNENYKNENNIINNVNISIQYNPVLGKKKCNKCFNLIILNNNIYCLKRGKIKKNSWYKCLYWLEKSIDAVKEKYGLLYYKRGSTRNN